MLLYSSYYSSYLYQREHYASLSSILKEQSSKIEELGGLPCLLDKTESKITNHRGTYYSNNGIISWYGGVVVAWHELSSQSVEHKQGEERERVESMWKSFQFFRVKT